MKATIASLAFVIAFCGLAIAQEPPPPAEGPITVQAPPAMQVGPGTEGRVVRGPGAVYRISGPGKWWKDSALMQKIGVSDEQVQRIEKIFQDHRLQLIDLHADLEKQEAILEPLVEADQPEEAQVIAQIDKVAQARAKLEKSDALMLLAIRRVLTVDQWKKLRDLPGINRFHAGPEVRMFAPAPAAPMPPAMPPPREYDPQSEGEAGAGLQGKPLARGRRCLLCHQPPSSSPAAKISPPASRAFVSSVSRKDSRRTSPRCSFSNIVCKD